MVMSQGFADFAAGVAAGVASVAAGHPFDTCKVRLQSQAARRQYRGLWHCFTDIMRHEGVRGLYRGASSPLIGSPLENAVLFAVYSSVKKALPANKDGTPSWKAVAVGGAAAGAAVAGILTPVELIKCRMQVGTGGARYGGAMDVVHKTVATQGFRGLFRGFGATVLRESPGNVAYFASYEALRPRVACWLGATDADRTDDRITARKVAVEGAAAVVSGGLAGVAFWAIVLPVDVIKTRIQTEAIAGAARGTVFQQLHVLARTSGVRGLYAGFVPAILRAFPTNAAAFVAFELASWQLSAFVKKEMMTALPEFDKSTAAALNTNTL